MILKLLITLIFTATAMGKLSGKMGPNWDRWGYSRLFMKATGAAELVALGLFWWPGLELVAAAGWALESGRHEFLERTLVPSIRAIFVEDRRRPFDLARQKH